MFLRGHHSGQCLQTSRIALTMKVLLAFVLAVSSVSSLGSGPYLPSGWRPSGPAFFLPSEVRAAPEPIATTLEPKTPEAIVLTSEPTSLEVKIPESTEQPLELTSLEEKTPESTITPSELSASEERTTESASISAELVQEVSQENVASGSDFLREYGPPAVLDIHQSITVQGLPDIVTEHTFKVDDAKISQDEPVSLKAVEEITATVSSVEPKSNEEEMIVQTDATIEAKSRQAASTMEAVTGEDISEVTTAKFEEIIVQQEIVTSSPSETEGPAKFEENSVPLEKSSNPEAEVTEGNSLEYLPPVSNEELIQDNDAIAKDDAVKLEVPLTPSEKSEDSDAVKSEINECEEKVEESSGSGQVPDVLDEQERVGFREYGPPKSENYEKSETERIENNETRRRRFSSRFASFKKH